MVGSPCSAWRRRQRPSPQNKNAWRLAIQSGPRGGRQLPPRRRQSAPASRPGAGLLSPHSGGRRQYRDSRVSGRRCCAWFPHCGRAGLPAHTADRPHALKIKRPLA